MRKRLISILAMAAVAAIAVAGFAMAADKPVVIRLGNLILTANGSFSPKALPKHTPSPITLNVSGKIETADGTHPPAVKEFLVETDKNGFLNAKGVPVCSSNKLQAQTTDNAKKACPTAIIGEGKASAEIAFAEQKPIIVPTKLIAFNGGVAGGKTTFFVHAYFSAPVNGAIVTTVKVSKIHNGRYGLKAIATIPPLAGGAGSAVEFQLTLHRTFNYKGKKQSYFLAQCPDGHLNAHAVGIFSNGDALAGNFVRSCTPKG
jgi:hypothetical protein